MVEAEDLLTAVPEEDKALSAAPEKCTKLFVPNAERNAKSPSAQQETVRSTAENASLRRNSQGQKRADKQNTPEKKVREAGLRPQKMLTCKSWLS